jgi:diaminopimelate decarboxylase
VNAVPPQLFPQTAAVDAEGHLTVGGVRLTNIAAEFGTPAFVYDEAHLESRCREAVAAFPGGAAYAAKAFLSVAMAKIALECGMNIDVATGGELHVAVAAGFPADRIHLHGNNKSDAELSTAIEMNLNSIVVDSFDEIDRIERLLQNNPVDHDVRCWVRVNPGIEVHAHEYTMTGQDDSKFGLSLVNGEAQQAIDRLRSINGVVVTAAHAHVGSQVYGLTGFEREVELLVPFTLKNGLKHLCVGGGLGVAYVTGEHGATLTEWGELIHQGARAAGLPEDVSISVEPGRAIVAQAAITLYTVGTIKDIPGIRTYVSVDGGMSDNPRPVLYGSGYETFLPRSSQALRERRVTVVGKHCESGDLLVKDAIIPTDTRVGDILATPVTGAYGYTMASNYNKVPRPPIVFVKDGRARMVVRRETFDDLLRLDVD